MLKRWALRLMLLAALLAACCAAVLADEGENWYDEAGEEFFWEQEISSDESGEEALEEAPEEAEPAEPVIFPDVTAECWFYDAVMALYQNGIIGGFPDGTFRPESSVTTGQALKMILLAAGYSEPPTAESHWARGYLNFALDAGILTRGEITDLDVSITRGMAAKLAARALGLSRIDSWQRFSDTNDDSAHALAEIGVIGGYPDGTFRPGGTLSRAELSAIVQRIYDYRAAQAESGSSDASDAQPDITLRTTENGVSFIKAREGFTATAYWDYQQYSIGYGSYCEKDEYPDGITEAEADYLLRLRLQEFEEKLDAFLDKNNIRLSTSQYDALMSFTYNNGEYWMSEKSPSRLATLLISGRYSVNEFASAYGIWCHVETSAGMQIYAGLIERRLRELSLFFYGDYNSTGTDDFHYVIFQTDKGSLEVDVAVYAAGGYYEPMFEASCEGDTFFGWVTEDGVVIDETTRVTRDLTLRALWLSEAEGF